MGANLTGYSSAISHFPSERNVSYLRRFKKELRIFAQSFHWCKLEISTRLSIVTLLIIVMGGTTAV